ncbi:MAG TPA: hypothetical protein VM364_21545 [Vicinamibacterales bacterium]|nr:hypothetical protein [Vicinamibacterales bacterium]
MRALIIDLARRNARGAAGFGIALTVVWGIAALVEEPSPGALGLSMGLAFGLGPFRLLWLVPRPIWYLPVSRRDLWRSAWVMATAGAALLTTTAKLIAVAILGTTAPYGVATLMLSSVYDFAYAGVGCGLVILATAPLPRQAPWHQMSRLWKAVGEVALPLGLPVAALGAIYTDLLPMRWRDLDVASGSVLAAALAVTVGTYFHTPTPAPRVPDGSILFTRAAAPGGRADTAGRIPRLAFRRLTGVPRLLLHEYVWSIAIGAALAAASALVVLLAANAFDTEEALADVTRALLLLPAGTDASRNGYAFNAVALLIWYAFFVATLAARFPVMMRHLRVLPLSARQVNLLLVAWPVMIWLTVWIALLALRQAVAGEGLTWGHLALFAGMWGLSALVQSLTLRLRGPMRVFVFSAMAGVVPLLTLLSSPTPAALGALGLGGLGAAALLNHAALRRPSTYRQADPVVGAVAPG